MPDNFAKEAICVAEIDPRIIRMCDAYKRAIYEKDVEAFVGLYHREARVFDAWEVWSYENAGERREVVVEWFTSLGDERVRVTIDRMRAVVVHDLATLSARAVYAALSAAGEELRAMQNRLTWVLGLEGGAWKIVHEHTSAPIGFKDLKGLLHPE
jgi:ketosteroid isomerase-like protein